MTITSIFREHEFQEKKSQSQNSIQPFELARTFLALVGLPFCPPGRYCSTASSEKRAGKFKMLYQVLTLRFFLLKSML